jgi:hypothetical protein
MQQLIQYYNKTRGIGHTRFLVNCILHSNLKKIIVVIADRDQERMIYNYIDEELVKMWVSRKWYKVLYDRFKGITLSSFRKTCVNKIRIMTLNGIKNHALDGHNAPILFDNYAMMRLLSEQDGRISRI